MVFLSCFLSCGVVIESGDFCAPAGRTAGDFVWRKEYE
jgi:hypothetical protein